MESRRQLALCVDVESAAARRKAVPRTLMSLGLACLEITSGQPQVVNTQRIVLDWTAEGGLNYDDDTAAWWARFPEAHRVSTTGGVPPSKAAWQAQTFVNEVAETAAKRRLSLVVLTDNAAFDLAWYDWLVCTYLSDGVGRPLSHDRDLKFRGAQRVVDLQQHLQAHRLAGTDLSCAGHVPSLTPPGTSKHDPLYDAVALGEEYACYLRRAAKLRAAAAAAP